MWLENIAKILYLLELHVYKEYLPNISIENNSIPDGARGYRMFGVHNQIQDPAYKGRFKVIKTETSAHQIIYSLKIKSKGPFVYAFSGGSAW